MSGPIRKGHYRNVSVCIREPRSAIYAKHCISSSRVLGLKSRLIEGTRNANFSPTGVRKYSLSADVRFLRLDLLM